MDDELTKALPQPVPGIIEQEMDDGLLLLRETGEYLFLNHSGAVIWQALSQVKSVKELYHILAGQPSIPTGEVLRSQLREYLKSLVAEGFLQEST